MLTVQRALMVTLAVGVSIVAAGQFASPTFSMRQAMTTEEFRVAGLSKLTAPELASLDRWLNNYTLRVLRVAGSAAGASSSRGAREYSVELSHNDELFVINGEKFEAKTYCFNVEKGDRVIFSEGGPNGVCTSAEFVNLRTNRKCAVWCE